jgi:predicted dehydrogenase
MLENVWLIGASDMAIVYTAILQDLKYQITVIGRGKISARRFSEKTGLKVITGGTENFLSTNPALPDAAIIAVSVDQLSSVSEALINYGVNKILVEKPAGLNSMQIQNVHAAAVRNKCSVYVAYNRRFYASTLAAQKIIKEDEGVSSFCFEFTEWNHVIDKLDTMPSIKEHWFLANSTHVVDLAFFLGGKPQTISCYSGGRLSWHPAGSVFCGAGISESGAYFSYHSNWDAPGRWGVEILTSNHRLIFRPMEQLQIQKRGSVTIEQVPIDNELDTKYKPGLYLQVDNFLKNNYSQLCSIKEQVDSLEMYSKIVHYS